MNILKVTYSFKMACQNTKLDSLDCPGCATVKALPQGWFSLCNYCSFTGLVGPVRCFDVLKLYFKFGLK